MLVEEKHRGKDDQDKEDAPGDPARVRALLGDPPPPLRACARRLKVPSHRGGGLDLGVPGRGGARGFGLVRAMVSGVQGPSVVDLLGLVVASPEVILPGGALPDTRELKYTIQ